MRNRADNPLARGCRRGRVRPGHFKIGARARKTFSVLLVEDGLALLVEGFQLIVEPADIYELVVPSTFEFTRDETIVSIHGIMLSPCARGFVGLLFQRQFDLPALFHGLGLLLLDRPKSRRDTERVHKCDDLGSNGRVDTQAAEGDAPVYSMIDEASIAMILADITAAPR